MFFKNIKSEAGVTLVELMIALAIAGVITAAMYSVFQGQVRGQRTQDIALQMTQSVRAAMEIMAYDFRMAGCDPLETADAAIEVADAHNIILSMDIGGNADGSPNGIIEANERVRYAINTSNHLGRASGLNNLPSPLHTLHSVDIECDALDFVYLDGDGNVLAPVTNMDDIAAVQVNIRVHWVAEPDRWFELENTISCRNL